MHWEWVWTKWFLSILRGLAECGGEALPESTHVWQTALGTNVLTIQSGPKPGTIRNPFTTLGLTSHGLLTGIGLKSMRFASVQQLSTAITACLERPEIQQKAAMLSRQLAKEPRVTRGCQGGMRQKWEVHWCWLVVSNMFYIFSMIYGMSSFPLTNFFQDG